jgi:hypothetical protein
MYSVFRITCRHSLKEQRSIRVVIFFQLLSHTILWMLCGKPWKNSAFYWLNVLNWAWQQVNGKFERNMVVFLPKFQEFSLLGCNAVKLDESEPTFPRNFSPPTSTRNQNEACSKYYLLFSEISVDIQRAAQCYIREESSLLPMLWERQTLLSKSV